MSNEGTAIFNQLAEGLAERLDRPVESFTPETTIDSLGLDSLDLAELIIEMESRLGIEIETDRKILSLNDIVVMIEKIKG